MKSTEFLQAAMDVQKERGEQYDKPNGERSMAATVSAFNCITGSTLEESDGWLLLSLLKLVRQAQNPEQYHHDSALDFVAYASLYAEAASEQCGKVDSDPVAAPNIPDEYDWQDAEDKYNWLVTDREGAFWFVNEPALKPHGQAWEHPGKGNMETINENPQPVAKYRRPTSTAQ